MNKIKVFVFLFGCLVTSYISYSLYCYFFDSSAPKISIIGIESDAYYKGEIAATVTLSDGYKVQEVAVFLDDNQLGKQEKIGKNVYEYQLVIPSKGIPDGQHQLRIEAVDASYARNRSTEQLSFFVDNKPLYAAFSKPDVQYKVFQGRTLHVQFQVSKEIKEAYLETLSKRFICFPESPKSRVYECYIPIACEETPSEYLFSVTILDAVGSKAVLENKFQIIAYPFKKQRIDVKEEKLKKESENSRTHEEFERLVAETTERSPLKKLWQGSFVLPSEVKEIGAEFGVQRTSQQRGRYIHQGLDILNTPRAIVWASQGGVVVIKDRFEISGNTVVIDHGYGILSMYFHLEDFAQINVGDQIKKGSPVGKIGMTGYATGYHLHWEMRINNIPVDPIQWTKADF